MPYRTTTTPADRTRAIAAVVLIHAALGALLLNASTKVEAPAPPDDTLLIDIPPEAEPPPEVRSKLRPKDAEGAAGKKAEATPVVAPPSRIPAASPFVAAPVAGSGAAPTSGATTAGTGSGAGGSGSGTGGGGGGTGAQWISGGLRDSDYPRAALAERLGGTVSVRFTVLTTGRIADCRVTRSSGSALLDGTTCRLLTERLRFRPATNSAGQPVTSSVGSDFTWGVRTRR